MKRTGITVLRKLVAGVCRITSNYHGLLTNNPDVPPAIKSATLALVAACQAAGWDKTTYQSPSQN